MVLTPEQNQESVNRRVESFLEQYTSKYIIVIDFDGLLVLDNLSKVVTEELGGTAERDELIKQYGDNTFELISRLNVLTSKKYQESSRTMRDLVELVDWRENTLYFLNHFQKQEDCTLLILSCGNYDVIKEKLASTKLQHIPVISTKIDQESLENELVVDYEAKSDVVEKLRKSSNFKRIYALGHSHSDIPMLKTANVGIALRENPQLPEVEQHADFLAEHLTEVVDYIVEQEKK